MPQSNDLAGCMNHNMLLRDLPEEEGNLLRPALRRMDLKPGETLSRRGDLIDTLIFPISGVVSLLSPTGPETGSEVAIIGRDGVVGVTAMLLPDAAMPWVTLVQIGAEAVCLPSSHLRGIARHAPVLWERMCRFVEALLFHISQTAACNARHSVPERLARWLLVALDRLDGDIVPLTHEFLAAMLGVRRAGVTVTANELQDRRLIKAGRGRITVTDRAGLEQASCACYRIIHQNEAHVQARNARATGTAASPLWSDAPDHVAV